MHLWKSTVNFSFKCESLPAENRHQMSNLRSRCDLISNSKMGRLGPATLISEFIQSISIYQLKFLWDVFPFQIISNIQNSENIISNFQFQHMGFYSLLSIQFSFFKFPNVQLSSCPAIPKFQICRFQYSTKVFWKHVITLHY